MTASSETNGGNDGVDRRGFLKCMAWAGTGLLWTTGGGVPSSRVFGQAGGRQDGRVLVRPDQRQPHRVRQGPDRKTVIATLEEAVARINALPERPDFLIHTGDLTHLSTAKEFDTVSEILKGAKVGKVFYVPGEHDLIGDGSEYLKRFGEGTKGEGWYSFDHRGVHFVGLVNVASEGTDQGLGVLDVEQLDWLKADVAGLADSTPIVVYAHVPLWSVYPRGAGARGTACRRSSSSSGSVRSLSSTATSTRRSRRSKERDLPHRPFHRLSPARAGQAAAPGPMKDIPAGKLRTLLGVTTVRYREGQPPWPSPTCRSSDDRDRWRYRTAGEFAELSRADTLVMRVGDRG